MNKIELVEHSEHDPSLCDFARIWLITQWIANTHMSIIHSLTAMQLVEIGYKSYMYSQDVENTELYASYGITLEQLFDFSEFVRIYLMEQIQAEYAMQRTDYTKAYLN